MNARADIAIAPAAWRRAWMIWCVLALGVRAWQIATEPAYLHPDALHQALEPAFRWIWGYGDVAWEFREGVRSWAWPGSLALPMALCRWLGASGDGVGMAPAIAAARGVVALIDVAGLVMIARLAWRRAGPVTAWAVGLVLAVHPAFAVVGAQPLVEVPATAALAWACEHAFDRNGMQRARALRLGIALGLTAMLRIQLWPALAVVVLALVLRSRKGVLRWDDGARQRLLLGVLAVLLAFAALDWVTWGAPLHSLRAYLAFNLGGAERFGVMPVDRYWRDLGLALPGLGVGMLVLASLAARRAPWLLAVLVAVALPHQLIAHREWRFLHPALPLLTLLAALGVDTIVHAIASSARARLAHVLAVVLVLGVAGSTVLAWSRGAPWETTWLFDRGGWPVVVRARGLDRAMLALSARPSPTAVVQAVLPAAGAPGFALLGHDVRVLHTLGAPPDAASLATVDAWIVGPEQPAPPELTVAFVDDESGVQLVVAPRGD